MMDKTRTIVKIGGKEYMMAGFEPEEYIHRVAIYVDRKMSVLKMQYVNLNPNTLSVLTALNVADDLLKLQEQFEALNEEFVQIAAENKRLRTELSFDKDHRSNVSAIKKDKGQLFDGYK